MIPLSMSKVPSNQSVRTVRHMLGSEETCLREGAGESVRPVQRVLGSESLQVSEGQWIPLPFVWPSALSEAHDDDGVHLNRAHTLADMRSAQLEDPDVLRSFNMD